MNFINYYYCLFTTLKMFQASVQEIDTLNAASRGPDHLRAKYGLTKLSDMSKDEFNEIHLSDEKPHHNRNRRLRQSWKRHDKNYKYDDNSDSSSANYIRKKRATLPQRVDW